MNVMKFHKIGDATKTMRIKISQKLANLNAKYEASRQLTRAEACKYAMGKGYAPSRSAK